MCVCGCCVRRQSFFLLRSLWTQPWERLSQRQTNRNPTELITKKGDFLSPRVLICSAHVKYWVCAVNCPGSLFAQKQWQSSAVKIHWGETSAQLSALVNLTWHHSNKNNSKRKEQDERTMRDSARALLWEQLQTSQTASPATQGLKPF